MWKIRRGWAWLRHLRYTRAASNRPQCFRTESQATKSGYRKFATRDSRKNFAGEAKEVEFSAAETDSSRANSRKCRGFPDKAETPRRDDSGWLRMQSQSNPSPLWNSLLTGKKTVNFADSGTPPRFSRLVSERVQWLAAKFPTQWNREFFGAKREFSLRNREFSWRNRSSNCDLVSDRIWIENDRIYCCG